MGATRGILFTITTYGQWLRGDARGWVEDGIVFPEAPALAAYDGANLAHEPYLFPRDRWLDVGGAIGTALRDRLGVRVYALAVQGWHVHGLVGSTRHDIGEVVKCAKDAGRWCLRVERPIWADGYDKRWCFDWDIVGVRLRYVQRHNVRNGWAADPWPFLVVPPELTARLAANPI